MMINFPMLFVSVTHQLNSAQPLGGRRSHGTAGAVGPGRCGALRGRAIVASGSVERASGPVASAVLQR